MDFFWLSRKWSETGKLTDLMVIYNKHLSIGQIQEKDLEKFEIK